MRLYIVRHGQTDINKNNLINSWNDEDLNNVGIAEAKTLINDIKKIDYDLIICSPLTRTRHTASIINIKNKDVIIDKRIIERNAGKLTKTALSNIDRSDWWNINPKCNYQDSETVLNLMSRINSFIDDLKKRFSNKKILIVTHGGISKIIHAYFYGIPENGSLQEYKCNNCEIKIYNLK